MRKFVREEAIYVEFAFEGEEYQENMDLIKRKKEKKSECNNQYYFCSFT